MPITITRPATDLVERRRAARTAVPGAVTVRERTRSACPAELADLSPLGCRITGAGLLVGGTPLWVRLPGLDSQGGEIVWSDGIRAGIAFHRPLHPAVADSLMLALAGNENAPAAAADTAGQGVPPAAAGLLSRREQIVQGVVETERSPLLTRKRRTGLGLSGLISRTVARDADHRRECRFADGESTGPMALVVDGEPARIVNIAPSGLKVRAAIAADIGDRVEVRFDGFDPISGTVIWLRPGEAGIALPADSLDVREPAAA